MFTFDVLAETEMTNDLLELILLQKFHEQRFSSGGLLA